MTSLHKPAPPGRSTTNPLTLVACDEPSTSAHPWRTGGLAGAVLLPIALLVFAALQYFVPGNYASLFWGHNPSAGIQWLRHLSLPATSPLPAAVYRPCFQSVLLLLWASYGLMMAGLWRGAIGTRRLSRLVPVAALLFAVFCPPTLSTDAYAYVGYARMAALYHLNPYTHLPHILAQAGDPITPYLFWDWPTVYGPVWTLLATGIVAILHTADIWWQILGIKVLGALSLLLAAGAGRGLAERLDPGRGALAFLAIGLNPLLLIEGVGNGHNDMLLTALLLTAALAQREKRYAVAGLLLGCSLGIKPITAAVLPWMLCDGGQGQAPTQKLRRAFLMTALALAPILVCYVPFWEGPATLAPLQARNFFMMDAHALAQVAALGQWLAEHGAPAPLIPVVISVIRQWPLVAVYAGLSLWLWRCPSRGGWLTAWSLLSPALMFLGMGIPFPWYLLWVWMVLLTRWDRHHLILSGACFGLSLLWECLYTCWRAVGG